MSNPNATRYVIRADLPVVEHLPPQTVYWRDGRGWATRRLATVYTALDDVNTALDHGVPVADLRFCKVRTLKSKAAPHGEASTMHAPVVPDGWTDLRLDVLAFGNVGYDYATVQAAPGTIALGEVVSVRGHRLTVREINGDLVQLNNKTHGL